MILALTISRTDWNWKASWSPETTWSDSRPESTQKQTSNCREQSSQGLIVPITLSTRLFYAWSKASEPRSSLLSQFLTIYMANWRAWSFLIGSLTLRQIQLQKYHLSRDWKNGYLRLPTLILKPLRKLRTTASVTPSLSSLWQKDSRNPLFVWQMMRLNSPAKSSLSPWISKTVEAYNKEVPYTCSSGALLSK